LHSRLPTRWQIDFAGLTFWIRPTSFKHTGLFPEQSTNWEWMESRIKYAQAKTDQPVSVLNLFGYTGGATLACAKAGAEVCHVDGSKVAIQWGRDNATLSHLESKPIRWILDDVRSFVQREIKRGRKYDGIILDPPAFGHGPNKEVWKIEEHLVPLLKLCREVMSDTPLFFVLNGYAAGYSAIAYENNLQELFMRDGGVFEKGELTIAEETGRLLPCGIFARWSKTTE
jgi:23S rRNA (cytosine1962-C5)-methyltransferase